MHRTHPEHRSLSSHPAPNAPPPRVALLPLAPDHLLALVTPSDDASPVGPADLFAARFGHPVADGIVEMFASGDVSPAWLARLRAATAADPWEHGFAVLHRDDGRVIGTAAFKGPPDADGVVEIAYALDPAYQKRGYAREAARALTAFALGPGGARRVVAHTRPEHGPSARVLEACGFARTGEVVDPEDGPVWRWELADPAALPPEA